MLVAIFLMLLSNVLNLTFQLTIHGNHNKNMTCQFLNEVSDNQRLALHYRWLVILQVTMDVSLYIFYTSGSEFHVSQCPYAMKGLVIGARNSAYGVSVDLYEVFVKIVWSHNSKINGCNCGLWYYLAFILMSLLIL